MADEENLESPGTGEGSEVPAAQVAVAEKAVEPANGHDAGNLKWISFLFVTLAAVGVFSYGADSPSPGVLGLGLLGWGILDLIGQRKKLAIWSGHQTGSNLLNMTRCGFLIALGSLLMLQAFGIMHVFGSNTLLVASVSFLAGYLLGAYALELATQKGDSFNHALLMGAFGLQFLSFFCFSVIFSVTWAGLFAFLSLGMAGWSISRGVLKAAPTIAPNVALVTLLLSLPFFIFMLREVVTKDLQPVYQSSLFVPRFHSLKEDLSRQATDLVWSPGHTQPGQPGDIPYSDKIAFVDERSGKKYLTVFAQDEMGGAITERPLASEFGKHWWAPNSKTLAMTEVNPASHKRVLLALQLDDAVFESKGERLFHFTPMTVSAQNVVPQDTHGQIFSPDGKNLYYSAPQSKPQHGNTEIFKADLEAEKSAPLGSAFKVDPAASPDASKVLYLGYKDNVNFLQVGDGMTGSNPRLFNYQLEKQLFPAWNAKQTHVLFLDPAGELKIMSANNKSDAVLFTSSHLNSRLWKTESGSYFTLEKMQTGALWQIWTMQPNGKGHKMIYESDASEIFPPMWSSDSKRIAFIERKGNRFNVMTLGRDGEWPRRVFVTSDPIRSLTWSPDAQRLAWFTDRDGGKHDELWVAEKQSLNPELVYSSDGALDSLSWSRAGQHIAFEEKWFFSLAGLRIVRPDLYSAKILDIKDHQARSLTAGGLFARQPAFSPQGVMVAFLTEQPSFSLFPGNWSLVPAPHRPASLAVAQLY